MSSEPSLCACVNTTWDAEPASHPRTEYSSSLSLLSLLLWCQDFSTRLKIEQPDTTHRFDSAVDGANMQGCGDWFQQGGGWAQHLYCVLSSLSGRGFNNITMEQGWYVSDAGPGLRCNSTMELLAWFSGSPRGLSRWCPWIDSFST